MDPPPSQISRAWSVWSYVTEAVGRFLRPVEVAQHSDGQEPEDSNAEFNVRAEGAEETQTAPITSSVENIPQSTVTWEECDSNNGVGPVKENIKYIVQFTRGSDSHSLESDEREETEEIADTGLHVAKEMSTEEEEVENDGKQHFIGKVARTLKTDENEERDDFGSSRLTHVTVSDNMQETNRNSGLEETGGIMPHDGRQKVGETLKNVQVKDWNEGEEVFIEDETQDLKDACTVRCSGSEDYAGQLCTLVSPEKDSNIYREDLALARQEKCRGKEHDAAIKKETKRNTSVSEQASALSDSEDENDLTSDEKLVEHGGGDETQDKTQDLKDACTVRCSGSEEYAGQLCTLVGPEKDSNIYREDLALARQEKCRGKEHDAAIKKETERNTSVSEQASALYDDENNLTSDEELVEHGGGDVQEAELICEEILDRNSDVTASEAAQVAQQKTTYNNRAVASDHDTVGVQVQMMDERLQKTENNDANDLNMTEDRSIAVEREQCVEIKAQIDDEEKEMTKSNILDCGFEAEDIADDDMSTDHIQVSEPITENMEIQLNRTQYEGGNQDCTAAQLGTVTQTTENVAADNQSMALSVMSEHIDHLTLTDGKAQLTEINIQFDEEKMRQDEDRVSSSEADIVNKTESAVTRNAVENECNNGGEIIGNLTRVTLSDNMEETNRNSGLEEETGTIMAVVIKETERLTSESEQSSTLSDSEEESDLTSDEGLVEHGRLDDQEAVLLCEEILDVSLEPSVMSEHIDILTVTDRKAQLTEINIPVDEEKTRPDEDKVSSSEEDIVHKTESAVTPIAVKHESNNGGEITGNLTHVTLSDNMEETNRNSGLEEIGRIMAHDERQNVDIQVKDGNEGEEGLFEDETQSLKDACTVLCSGSEENSGQLYMSASPEKDSNIYREDVALLRQEEEEGRGMEHETVDRKETERHTSESEQSSTLSDSEDENDLTSDEGLVEHGGADDQVAVLLCEEILDENSDVTASEAAQDIQLQITYNNRAAASDHDITVGVQVQMIDERLQKTENNDANDLNTTEDGSIAVERELCVEIKAQIDDEEEMTESNVLDFGFEAESSADDDMSTDHIQVSEPITENMEIQLNRAQYEGGNQDCTAVLLGTVTQTTENVPAENQSMELSVMSEHIDHLTVTDGKAQLSEINIQVDEEKTRPDEDEVSSSEEDIVHKKEYAVTPIAVKNESNNGGEITGNLTHVTLSDNMEETNRNSGLEEEIGEIMAHDERQNVDIQVQDGIKGEEVLFENETQSLKDACTVLGAGSEENSGQLYMSASPEKDSNIYREDMALLRQEEEEGRGMEHETVVRKDTERHTSESEQSSTLSDSEDENDLTSDEGLVEHGGADDQVAVLLCEEILDENSDVTASEAAQDTQLQITYNNRAAASDHDITVGVQVQMMENNDANYLNTTEDGSIAVEREQCVEIKAQIDDKKDEMTESNVLDFGFEAKSSADDDMSTDHIQVSEPITENMEIQLNRAQYEGGNQDCTAVLLGTVTQTTENFPAENQSMELSVMSEHIDNLTVTDGKAKLTEINIPVDEEKTRPDEDEVSSSEEDIVHKKEYAVTPIVVKNESNNGGEITGNLTHVTLIDNSEEVVLLRQEEEEGRGMEHETVVVKETERHTSESEQSSTLLDSEDENDLTSDEGLVEHGRPDDQEAVLLCEEILDVSLEPSVMSEHINILTVTDRKAQLTEINIPVDEEKTRPDEDKVSSSEEDIVHKTESAVTPIAVKNESNNGGEITGNLTHVTLSDNMEETNRNSGLEEEIGEIMAHDERQNVDIQVKDGIKGEEVLFENKTQSLKDACTVLGAGSEENSGQLYMSASPEKDSNIYREDVALSRQEEEEGRGMEHETVVRKDTERHTSESEQSSTLSDSEDENDLTSDEGLVEHGGADEVAVLLYEEILDENSDVTASKAAQDTQLQITYNNRAAASDHDITVVVQVQMMDGRFQKTENNDANYLNTTENGSIAVEREQCVEIKAQIDDKKEEMTESNVLDVGFEAKSSADDDMSTDHIQVSEPITENMEIQLNRAQYEGGNQDCTAVLLGTVTQTTENVPAENQSMELSVMSEHIDHLTLTDGKAQLSEINIPVDEEKTRPDEDEFSSSEEDIVHKKEYAVTPIVVKNENNNGGEITGNLTHVTLIDNSEEVVLLRQEEEEGRGMEHETVVVKETERHTSESEQSSTLSDSEDENDLTSDEGLVEHGRPDDQEAVLLCEEILDVSLEPSVMSEHINILTVTDRKAQLTEINIPVDEEKTRPDEDKVSSSEEDIVHKTESAVTPIAVKNESNNGGEITGNLTHVTLSDNMEETNRNSGLEEEIGEIMAHDERQNVDIQVKDGIKGEEVLFENETQSLKDACTVLGAGSEENSGQMYMSASPEKDSNIYREDMALLRQEEEEGREMEHETVVRKDTERHTSESEQSSTLSDSEDENDLTSDEGLVEHGGADDQVAVLLCEEILDENSDVTASEAAQDTQLQLTYNNRAAASDHDITVGVQVQMMDGRFQKTENNDANYLNTTEDGSIAVEREQCVEIKAQIDDKKEEMTESNVLYFGFEAKSSADDDMSTDHIQVSEPITENMEIQLNRAQYEGGNQDCTAVLLGTVTQTTENVPAENQSMELSVISEHIDNLTVTDGKAKLTEINIPVDEEKTRPDEDEVSSSEEDIVHKKEYAVTPIVVKNESNNGGEITGNLTHVTLIDNSEEVVLLRQEEEEGREMEHETVVVKETERHTSESEQSSTLLDSEDENDLTSDEGLVEHGRPDDQEAVLFCEEILDLSLEPSVMSEHIDILTVTDRKAQLTEINIPVDEEKTRPDEDKVSSSEEDIVHKTESAVTPIAVKNESNNGGEITGNLTHVTLSDNMEETNRNSGLEEEIGEIMAHDERQNVDIQVKDGIKGEEVLFENETQSLKDARTDLHSVSEENSGQLYMSASPEKDSNIYREDVALLRQEEEEGRGMEHETVVGKETERHTTESSTLSDSEDENNLTSDEGLVEHGRTDNQEAVLLYEEMLDENSDVTASEAEDDIQLQTTYNKRAAASDHDITVGVKVQMMDERLQKTENNDANDLNMTVSPEKDINIYREDGAMLRQEEEEGGADAQEAVLLCEEIFDENSDVTASEAAQDTQQKMTYNKRAAVSDHDITDGAQVMCDTLLKTENNYANDLNKTEDGCIAVERDQCVEINAQMDDKEKEITMGIILDCHFEAESSAGDDMGTEHIQVSEHMTENMEIQLNRAQYEGRNQDSIAAMLGTVTQTTENVSVENQSTELTGISHLTVTDGKAHLTDLNIADDEEETRPGENASDKNESALTPITVKTESNNGGEIMGVLRNTSPEISDRPVVVPVKLNSVVCEETQEGVPEYDNNELYEDTTQRILEVGDYEEIQTTQLPEEVGSKELESLIRTVGNGEAGHLFIHTEEQSSKLESALHIENMFDMVAEGHSGTLCLTDTELPREKEEPSTETIKDETAYISTAEFGPVDASLETGTRHSEHVSETDASSQDEWETDTEELLAEKNNEPDRKKGPVTDTQNNKTIEENVDELSEETVKFPKAQLHTVKVTGFVYQPIDPTVLEENISQTISLSESIVETRMMEQPTRPILNEEKEAQSMAMDVQDAGLNMQEIAGPGIKKTTAEKENSSIMNLQRMETTATSKTTDGEENALFAGSKTDIDIKVNPEQLLESIEINYDMFKKQHCTHMESAMDVGFYNTSLDIKSEPELKTLQEKEITRHEKADKVTELVGGDVRGMGGQHETDDEINDMWTETVLCKDTDNTEPQFIRKPTKKEPEEREHDPQRDIVTQPSGQDGDMSKLTEKEPQRVSINNEEPETELALRSETEILKTSPLVESGYTAVGQFPREGASAENETAVLKLSGAEVFQAIHETADSMSEFAISALSVKSPEIEDGDMKGADETQESCVQEDWSTHTIHMQTGFLKNIYDATTVSSEAREDELSYQSQENGETDIVKLMGTETELQVIDPEMSDSDLQEKTNWEISKGKEEDISQTKTCALFQGEAVNTEDKPFGAIVLNVTDEMKAVHSGKAYKSQEAESEVLGQRSEPVVVLEGRIEYYLHKNTCLKGQDQLCGIPEALSGRKAAASPVELSTADDAEELASPLPTPGDQLELDFRRRRRIAIKNPHALPQKDPHTLVQIPSVEPTPPKPSGHLPMKGLTAVPMGGLDTGIKLPARRRRTNALRRPGRGSSPAGSVLKKTNVSREENSTEDGSQKKTETKVNDVSPGPVVVLEGRTLTESDLHKNTYLEGQDQVCDVLDNAHSGRKAASSPVELSTADDDAEELASPLPTPGDQLELDFTPQKTRIAIKNPHVRPPKDPRALVQMPSVEPTPPKPSGHLPMKGHTAVPMGGLGIGIKLPGFGAGFPVLKKTNVSRQEENPTQDCLQKETETKLDVNDVSPGPVVVLEERVLTESDLHKKTCLEGQDQVCDVLDKAHSVRKAASSPVELSTADDAEELATPLPTPGDQLEFNALDFTPQKTRIAIKNPHVRPPKDPRALLQMPSVEPTLSKPSGHLPIKGLTAVPMGGLGIGIKLPGFGADFPVLKKTNVSREGNRTEDSPQMPSVEPTPPKPSGHLPMKGHTAVPMGGLGMGIKLPGFGAGFPVLKKTNVSREENRTQDCLQKETETNLYVNDVSPGPVVVLERRILTESDLHKKTCLEDQDQVCDVLDKAHSGRKAASSPAELSTADDAEELATPLPTPGDQLEFNALDFTPQKTRIAIKNPHVRPPKDPRALLQMPSVEPTLSKPSGHLPIKGLTAVPMGGLGIGIKLPGFGAGFPVLKKTSVSREENRTEYSPQTRIDIKNPHVRPPKDPCALVQMPSVEPTPPKPSGHLPMKGHSAVPMGGLGMGIKLPGFGAGFPVLKKTNVSREETRIHDCLQKETETKLEVNDVSPGPVVVLEGRILTESDLHKKTCLEGQDQELSTADNAEELASPLPTPGDQLEFNALDFTPQKTRIAIKNPHVRPPKDPRALLQMPSVEPTPSKPSGRLPMKRLAGVPMGGLGVGIKLPGFGAEFPVLKKTNVSREENLTGDCPQIETETKQEVNYGSPRQDMAEHKPKWMPPRQPGFGNPLMSELKNKLKKTTKE